MDLPIARSRRGARCSSRSGATTRSASRSAAASRRSVRSTSSTSTPTPTSLDELDGARLTGASQLRRLAELAFVETVSAVGLRNVDRREIDGLGELGGRWATTRDIVERGPRAVVADTVREAGALYVTADLDVLDSSVAPGHSLPEPGGLGYAELRALLVEVARRGRVVAFDVVELAPARDPSGATARVAAWAAPHLLSEIFDRSA